MLENLYSGISKNPNVRKRRGRKSVTKEKKNMTK